MASRQQGAQAEVVTRIKAMITDEVIEDIATASVIGRDAPSFDGFGTELGKPTDKPTTHLFPGIVVCPVGSERIKPATNVSNDHGYPVLVVIADQVTTAAVDAFWSGNSDPLTVYRELIINEFISQRMTLTTPVVSFFNCEVEPAQIIDWGKFAQQKMIISAFTLRFWARVQFGN